MPSASLQKRGERSSSFTGVRRKRNGAEGNGHSSTSTAPFESREKERLKLFSWRPRKGKENDRGS